MFVHLSLIPLLPSFGGVRALTPPKPGVMWIPCPRTNTPRKNVETPSVFQTSFLEAMLGELGRLSYLEPRHGSFSSTFRRRILCRDISPSGFPRRDFGKPRWKVLWPECRGSNDNCSPSVLTLSSIRVSLPSTDYCFSPCCHTLRRCSLIVKILCLRREKWDHYPSAVSTKKS